jgi:hypothetical protein
MLGLGAPSPQQTLEILGNCACTAWHAGGILSVVDRLSNWLGPLALGLAAWGCSSEETERLDPATVAMTDCTLPGHSADCEPLAPIYDDGELTLYEVKQEFQLPVITPGDQNLQRLYQSPVEPFDRTPWVTKDDIRVQVSFTLSNLDRGEHVVEVLVDPWNEFGRYWPGLQVVDAEEGELLPNLSGINERFLLPGTDHGEASRIYGTFTYDDMEEMAIDFATVMNIIENFEGLVLEEGETDPRVTYANHAFSRSNRSYNSPLIARYRPAIIPGLVGFDFGLRTEAEANVALEIFVEVIDVNDDKLVQEADDIPLRRPDEQITVGTAL